MLNHISFSTQEEVIGLSHLWFFVAARNLYSPSTTALDRHALVPAMPARYQAGSLLLLALPIPFLFNLLSMVKRKWALENTYYCARHSK